MNNFDIKNPNYLERADLLANESQIKTLEAMAEEAHLEVSDIRKHITDMKNSVALEMARTPYEEKDKIIKLQARMENYILLESILNREPQLLDQIRKFKQKKY